MYNVILDEDLLNSRERAQIMQSGGGITPARVRLTQTKAVHSAESLRAFQQHTCITKVGHKKTRQKEHTDLYHHKGLKSMWVP